MSKGWTEERRQKARERILKNKPWEKSTGPKSDVGKAISSLNALKHGRRSRRLTKAFKRIMDRSKFINEQAHYLYQVERAQHIEAKELIRLININREVIRGSAKK